MGLTGDPVFLRTSDDIIHKEATVKGTTGRNMWKTWWQMGQLLVSGRFDPRDVITLRFSLPDYPEAFEFARSKDHSRAVGLLFLLRLARLGVSSVPQEQARCQ